MASNPSLIEMWTKRLQDCRASGLSMFAWCKENGLHYSTLIYWRDRIEKPVRKNSQASLLNASSFSELTDGHPERTEIEIIVRTVTVRLHQGFDKSTLNSCLQAIVRS